RSKCLEPSEENDNVSSLKEQNISLHCLSQQKCIVVFALVCCFAVLVALIFSAVDIWGQDEDGITENNCNTNCRIVLVENIPEDLYYSDNGTLYLPLNLGLLSLLDSAEKTVEIVSSHWNLNATDMKQIHPSAWQGQEVFKRLLNLHLHQKTLKIASDLNHKDSSELKQLAKHGAEVHYLNMTALTKGQMHASFWVVDKKHIYIGSANMDWHSMAQMKELGVIIYNCSCLALDLHRMFTLFWQLEYKEFIPTIWSKRIFAISNIEKPHNLTLNDTNYDVFLSSSPNIFCPKGRTKDIDAIYKVISDAQRFIYVSVMDYLPLINRSNYHTENQVPLQREVLVLRRIKIRLLISCWKQTHPLTFNFVWSLMTLCTDLPNCSLEVKFFTPKDQYNNTFQTVNRNKFVVTDRAVYIGNFDWVGNDFTYNAGAGLTIIQKGAKPDKTNSTVIEQMKAIFEWDWYSRHAKSLQANKIPECIKQKLSKPASFKISPESMEGKDIF
uniref:Phospholipase D family member 5 n=1 Tax=Erpetoichthys calabaricus TaxID=27687 RepID=A0A8C4X6I6_ERPCA